MQKRKTAHHLLTVIALAAVCIFSPAVCAAEAKKGLLVYDSIYSSTTEVAYWIKAIIGNEQRLDVKKLDQVLTVTPYDYVIIGSYSKWEKPSPRIYKFVEFWKEELANKEVCYFLTGGDWDETMVLKAPGAPVKIIAGRNYLFDIQEKYPEIKPVVLGGFGGRQVMPTLQGTDGFMIWLLEKLSREGAHWVGNDIWESLVPERVEIFGNEIRTKILGVPPLADVEKYRGFWDSLQPASLKDPSKKKTTSLVTEDGGKTWIAKDKRPYTVKQNSPKIYYSRSRIKADLPTAGALLEAWAREEGLALKEMRKSSYMTYYTAVKQVEGKDMIIYLVAATMPDDPGNVHVSFRAWDKPEVRKPLEEAIDKGEQALWADGRKIDGR
ncbi:MAG: flavodoxin domain-containing protein [Pseudomonadota bacterium]